MKNLNSLNSSKENFSSANSLDDVKNFLQKNSVKQAIIQKVLTSFMAKIAPNTKIALKENTLHIGESKLFLGEDIFHKINEMKENVKQKVLSLSAPEQKLLAKKETPKLAAAN